MVIATFPQAEASNGNRGVNSFFENKAYEERSINFDATPDYKLNSVSKLNYYDRQGFEDNNEDGLITLLIKGVLDFSDTDKKGFSCVSDIPLVIKGTNKARILKANKFKFKSDVSVGIKNVEFTNPIQIQAGKTGYVEKCKFANVNGGSTGPILADCHLLSVRDSVFIHTRAQTGAYSNTEAQGGAIYCTGCLIIDNSSFRDIKTKGFGDVWDPPDHGGAIYSAGAVKVSDSEFVETKIVFDGNGGAIYTPSKIFVKDTLFKDTRAGSDGGAIFAGENAIVQNSVFINNDSGYSSSVIRTNGHLTVSDSVIKSGEDDSLGGQNGIYLKNCLVKNSGQLGYYDPSETAVDTKKIVVKRSFIWSTSFGSNVPSISLENTTIFKPGEEIARNISFRSLDVLEAEKPVFQEVPEKGKVFVDLNKDTESWGEWTPDVFWSADSPFRNYEKVGSDLEILELLLDTKSIEAGESFEVAVKVSNSGWREGTKKMKLLLNNEVIKKKSITVPPGKTITETLSFVCNKAGLYTINLADLSKEIKVEKVPTFKLTTSVKTRAKGSINLNPPKDVYKKGSRVTVTAEPASGYEFDHWSGDLSGTSKTKSVTMNENKLIIAHFVEVFNLSASTEPTEGGSISMNPSKDNYKKGTEVTVIAKPSSNYKFDHWSGDVSGTSKTKTVNVDSDINITAHFTETGGKGELPPFWIGVGAMIFIVIIIGVAIRKKL
ncbi:hypothetical protein AKJ36_00945 [candidate division MSBL1 archaeon SCGC-AAA259I07]|uniref:Bacterial repeat domain-containing protein n=1 Tax=candidate division MSBL1 archaeon SCGC-AAA259I07 TaxID=1698266 RepID=A0A133UMA2_9EURY|nr:hypothetical protein AKJ36_00945 [candidate division MSBL1 archaeon SCGC-AAA259I07]